MSGSRKKVILELVTKTGYFQYMMNRDVVKQTEKSLADFFTGIFRYPRLRHFNKKNGMISCRNDFMP